MTGRILSTKHNLEDRYIGVTILKLHMPSYPVMCHQTEFLFGNSIAYLQN